MCEPSSIGRKSGCGNQTGGLDETTQTPQTNLTNLLTPPAFATLSWATALATLACCQKQKQPAHTTQPDNLGQEDLGTVPAKNIRPRYALTVWTNPTSPSGPAQKITGNNTSPYQHLPTNRHHTLQQPTHNTITTSQQHKPHKTTTPPQNPPPLLREQPCEAGAVAKTPTTTNPTPDKQTK